MNANPIKLDAVESIVAVNRGRDPVLLARKFEAMASDPFVFLRASATLAHARLERDGMAPSPIGWVCGDLHLGNFGCFRGTNRLVYFDLNDFDEAARMPVAFDLLRLLASILTSAPGLKVERAAAAGLASYALRAYGAALARGKAFWLERDTARGPIRTLLEQVAARRRRDLLGRRTWLQRGRRVLAIDNLRYLPMPTGGDLPAQLSAALAELGELHERPEFFHPLGLARRVAGMGSLGVARYVALVRGGGSPDKNALIDFKLAVSSSASAALPALAQPRWADEAQRVVLVQDLCQAASPAYLTAMPVGGRAFVVRELQPVEDRVALEQLGRQPRRLAQTLAEMAQVSAYAHLRGASRWGAGDVDALTAFGRAILARPADWLEAAHRADARNLAAFRSFRRAWRQADARLTDLCRA